MKKLLSMFVLFAFVLGLGLSTYAATPKVKTTKKMVAVEKKMTTTAKKEEAKKPAAKKAAPTKAAPKKAAPTKAAPKKAAPKKAAPKKGTK